MNDEGSPITLLKLHGSLNWVRCASCGCFLLIRNVKADEVIWQQIRDANSALQPSMQCPKCGLSNAGLKLERIIIPPTIAKSYDSVEIRYLWRNAEAHANIDRIVTIGYSFSEQDAAVYMLLRNMVKNGNFNRRITIDIVNRNCEEVQLRLNRIFQQPTISKASPEQFFSELEKSRKG